MDTPKTLLTGNERVKASGPPDRSGATHRHRPVVFTAALLVVATILAGCSSSQPAASSTTSSSTVTSSSTTTTSTTPGNGGGIDGPDAGKLPQVPGPSRPPNRPDLATVAAQKAFLNEIFKDIQSMWKDEFAAARLGFQPARLDIFDTEVSTACGVQSAQVGPFYCPADRGVYLDLQFFRALERQFGVGGDFVEAYIVAHELGHHVQNLIGVTTRVAHANATAPAQKNALSIRVELQADCFAGVWAHSRYRRDLLKPGDIEQALAAAEIVGDDFLAHASGSTVDPDSWTHGSSAQRQRWFTTGFDRGRPDACDTFSVASP